jgi:uncharacterized protein YehS (DUF1456 family)
MKNNDILRRLRFTFDFGDDKMMKLFEKGGEAVTRAQISDWLKKEEDEAHKPLNDRLFATFLNGLIEDKRGAKEGAKPEPEKQLNNNIILRKLKIALNFKEDDMLEVFELAEFRIGKSELSAFFRNPNQSQYRECKDQFLRNFLIGLQLKYKPKV